VTALCHTRCGWLSKTDGTGSRLSLRGCNDLQDVVPIEMDISILSLGMIVSTWIDDESVVCVNISRLVHGVISTAQTPRIASATTSPSGAIIAVTVMLLLGIWSRWQSELHQMGDALLAASSMRILHAERFKILILIQSTEFLARFVLGFGRLLIAGCCGGGLSVGSTRRRGRVVLEELLCLRDGAQSGTDSRLGGFGAVDLTRQRQRAGIRHGGTASQGVAGRGGAGRRGGGDGKGVGGNTLGLDGYSSVNLRDRTAAERVKYCLLSSDE